MSAKRNPFNENVNRLMEKIFAGKEAPHTQKKNYQDEAVVQTDAGILHDAQPGKKRVAKGKAAKRPSEMQEGDIKAAKRDSAEFFLQDIRRTTEKIRETTKQMQQMTLQMWADTAKKREEAGKIYREELIPPCGDTRIKRDARTDNKTEPKRETGNPEGGAQHLSDRNPGMYQKALSEWQKSLQDSYQGTAQILPQQSTAPRRVPLPQYRMEEAPDASMPERIRECRALAHSPQGLRMTKEELFFRQARLMEDYEDDCLYPGDFSWYFPTYQAMSTPQLRGYFTWRAQVRKGNIMHAPVSFAFVYVYELLNQIGTQTPEEGFSLLKTFWENYREQDVLLDRYMKNWLCDYVVYYNLDRELLIQSQDIMFDDAMLVLLMHPQESKDEEYFAAICALAKYNMQGSKFYKEYPEDVRRVTCAVFRALSVYYEKHGKKTLTEKYFGTMTACAYQMFASAVFYDHIKYAEYEYEVNPLHRYRCINGHWSCEKYFGNRTKNKEMGNILHAIDMRMRERYEYKALLKPESMTKLVMNIIEKESDRLLTEKKKNAAPVIEIDVTKLSGIRRAAELTREKLIVEGAEEDFGNRDEPDADGGSAQIRALSAPETERYGMTGSVKEAEVMQRVLESDLFHTAVCAVSANQPGLAAPLKSGRSMTGSVKEAEGTDAEQMEFVWEDSVKPAQDTERQSEEKMPPENGSKPQQDLLLNEAERTLLRLLLEGAPYQEFLRERRLMLSVAVDAINEKLFDYFGDTVIVFEGDVPQVLEDYSKEAARLLSEM